MTDTASRILARAPYRLDSTPLIHTAPRPTLNTCVVIPVRDEAGHIGDALTALVNQTDADGSPIDPAGYEIIVLANNCLDDSAAIASGFAARHPNLCLHVVERTLPESAAHVGTARQMLMDEACNRLLTVNRPRGIIATTDGDTLVEPTWIAATRAEMRLGADAVGGRISLDPGTLRSLGPGRLRYHLRDVGYRTLVAELESTLDPVHHDPWPRHFQHFGASMAVTADAYLAAGGLPARPWLEDVAFYDALTAIDARIRHSPLVRVTTSAREQGRTGFGFAVQLTQWEAMDQALQPMAVESAGGLEAGIRARRALRQVWRAYHRGTSTLSPEHLAQLATALAVEPGWLHRAIATTTTLGSLAQQVRRAQDDTGVWRNQWSLVDIRVAIQDLRRRLETLRHGTPRLTLLEEIDPVLRSPATRQVS